MPSLACWLNMNAIVHIHACANVGEFPQWLEDLWYINEKIYTHKWWICIQEWRSNIADAYVAWKTCVQCCVYYLITATPHGKIYCVCVLSPKFSQVQCLQILSLKNFLNLVDRQARPGKPGVVGVVGVQGLQVERHLDKRKTAGHHKIYGLQCHSGDR